MKGMKDMKQGLLGGTERTECTENFQGPRKISNPTPTPTQENSPNALAGGLQRQGLMEVYRSPLGHKVIGCAIEVHKALGPGLLESAYERCLDREFEIQGLKFRRQVSLPVDYKGTQLDNGYRVDFVVEEEIAVELKALERVLPIHQAQVLTYLKLLKVRQAILLNFNVRRLVDGVKSFLL